MAQVLNQIFNSKTITKLTQVSPSNRLHITAHGIGYLEVTFATSIPPQFSQYAISSNTIEIPVTGSLTLELIGASAINPINVVTNVEEQHSSLASINITPVAIEQKSVKNVSISVSSSSVSSIVQDNVSVPPSQTLVFYVGNKNIQFAGYGVSFTVQDYDPKAAVPAGNAVSINLTNGSSTNFAEAPANAGIEVLKSYTGYIILSNFSGTGTVNLFTQGE